MAKSRLPSKKTKIISTIGPASRDQDVLAQMIANGMNIARINFAHGEFDAHRKTIANVRAAAQEMGKRVTIFGDLPGPKMRIGSLEEESIELQRGQPFVLQIAEIDGNRERVSLDFPALPQVVKPGDHIYVNDGYVQLRVDHVEDAEVHTVVEVGGELRSHKGVNFPGIDLGISAFTESDQEYLAFAAEQKLDGISQSFVLGPHDITAVREAAAALNYHPFIIAKIERAGALERIEGILEVTDAIMVARGDLGVEIPIEEIPAVQKHLIRLSNLASRPVITATQMLESMTEYRRPTRAEATDVANAILDGTDCVMLSGETAVGAFPIETVSVMTRIAQQTEAAMENGAVAAVLQAREEAGEIDRKDLLSLTVFLMAETLDPTNLFVPSRSGGTARRLSRFRMDQWLVAPTQNERTCQELAFSYGVYPILMDEGLISEPYLRRRWAADWLHEHGLEEGMVFLVESAGTLKAEDTKRIDIIALGSE